MQQFWVENLGYFFFFFSSVQLHSKSTSFLVPVQLSLLNNSKLFYHIVSAHPLDNQHNGSSQTDAPLKGTFNTLKPRSQCHDPGLD